MSAERLLDLAIHVTEVFLLRLEMLLRAFDDHGNQSHVNPFLLVNTLTVILCFYGIKSRPIFLFFKVILYKSSRKKSFNPLIFLI